MRTIFTSNDQMSNEQTLNDFICFASLKENNGFLVKAFVTEWYRTFNEMPKHFDSLEDCVDYCTNSCLWFRVLYDTTDEHIEILTIERDRCDDGWNRNVRYIITRNENVMRENDRPKETEETPKETFGITPNVSLA